MKAETKLPVGLSDVVRRRRVLTGVVVSDKMDKTIVVEVSRRVKDLHFKKYLTKKSTYKVHAENNEAGVGDEVQIVEVRPISKDKRWRLQKIVNSIHATSVDGSKESL